ncbi:Tigger transposable element-derived protein 5 [Ceratobasidium sp. 428]|nr:Tigger transposable element-derived protein 5 [Ceratobasidium sp. 428]
MVATVSRRVCRSGPKSSRQLSSATKAAASSKRKFLTYYDKLQIINFCRTYPHLTQVEVVLVFRSKFPHITQPTISRYLSREDEIRSYVARNPNRLGYARPVFVKLPVVEEALALWVEASLDDDQTHLTDDMICQKGRELAQSLDIPDNQRNVLKFTTGWLYPFKARMGLCSVHEITL